MKIISLKAENFKNLTAVELRLDGKGVIITGPNGAGKSNVLDAVITAFGGKKTAPQKPIKDGEEKAVIVLETEDIIIKRRYTEKGEYLEVTNKEDAVFKSPQSLLDKLVGSISFDPLAFARMEAKEQRKALLDLIQLDLAEFDEKYETLKQERSVVLSSIKELKVDFDRMEYVEGLPDKELNLSDLTEKLKKAHAVNAKHDELKAECEALGSSIAHDSDRIDDANAELKRLQDMVACQVQKIKDMEAVKEKHSKELSAASESLKKSSRVDTDTIEAEISHLEQKNRQIRNNAEYKAIEAKIDVKSKESSDYLQKMKQVESDKAKALSESPMPVKGLSVDENGVIFDGKPLKDGTNHAKQLEVCVAIGMAMNPKLNVMVMDINGVGSESLAAIQKMAADHEPPYQLLMEKMDETGKVGVYIKDGHIETDNTPADGPDGQGTEK